jgi:chromosome segregation ATPase
LTAAEEILKQQRAEQAKKKQPEQTVLTKSFQEQLAEKEAELKLQALNEGFDPANPVKAFHDAVDAFNKEKDEFDKRQAGYDVWVANYNTSLKLLNEAKAKFEKQVIEQATKNKAIETALTSKKQEMADTQKAIEALSLEISAKQGQLDDIEDRITMALRKCKKLVLSAENKKNYYYDLAMSDTWGRFGAWARNLFRDLGI